MQNISTRRKNPNPRTKKETSIVRQKRNFDFAFPTVQPGDFPIDVVTLTDNVLAREDMMETDPSQWTPEAVERFKKTK